MAFLPAFFLFLQLNFHFLKSIESISILKKCPASAGISFFCLIFSRYKHIIYFILNFCIQITSSFQLFYFIYFLVQYFFQVLILFDAFVYFNIFSNIFLKKYGFSSCFLVTFVVKFSFLKSIESISVLKKCPASAGILFLCLIFSRYKHIIYFILSRSFVSR